MKIIQVFVLVIFFTQTLVSGASLSGPFSDPVLGQNKLDEQTVGNVRSARTTKEQTDTPSIQSAPLTSSISMYLDPELITFEPEHYETEEPSKMIVIVVGSVVLIPLVLIPVCYGTGLLIIYCFNRKSMPNMQQNGSTPSGPMFATHNPSNPTGLLLLAENSRNPTEPNLKAQK